MGERQALQWAVVLYAALLPVAHAVVLPVGGAMANAADPLLAALVALALVAVVREGRAELGPGLPFLLMALFGLWAAVSGVWGFHPGYALAKGTGYTALALGAWAVVWSGVRWERMVDAWLVGALGALLFLYGGWLAGAVGALPWLEERVVYRAGAVSGLPFPRPRGPFLHPNLLGEYLVVTSALLWIRWPALREREPVLAWGGGALLAGTLLLTFASAWIGLGFLLGAWALWGRWGRAPGARRLRLGVGALGALLFVGTFSGMLFPLELGGGPLSVSTDGMRAWIWASASRAFLEAPVLGVGAAPFLAETPGPVLWDAHSLYLSLPGQFGLVGALLWGTGVGILVYRLAIRVGTGRVHGGLLAALGAVAFHGVGAAVEDFRHVWLLLAICGLAALQDNAPARSAAIQDETAQDGGHA